MHDVFIFHNTPRFPVTDSSTNIVPDKHFEPFCLRKAARVYKSAADIELHSLLCLHRRKRLESLLFRNKGKDKRHVYVFFFYFIFIYGLSRAVHRIRLLRIDLCRGRFMICDIIFLKLLTRYSEFSFFYCTKFKKQIILWTNSK